MTNAVEVINPLTPDERAKFLACNTVVQKYKDYFLQAGEALMTIRDGRLYRETFGTWEIYCEKQGLSKTHANRLIAAKAIASDLAPIGVTPSSEGQIRSLSELPPEQRAQAWLDAVDIADGQPTGAQVEQVVDRTKNDKTRHAVESSGHIRVIQDMRKGRHTPAKALAICDALSSSEPRVRGDMLLHDVVLPTLIREFNRIYKQNHRDDSTYMEIMRSGGYIQPGDRAETVHISKARPEHLRAYLDLVSYQHRQRVKAERGAANEVISMSFWLHINDPAATAKVLCDEFPDADLAAMVELISKYLDDAKARAFIQQVVTDAKASE